MENLERENALLRAQLARLGVSGRPPAQQELPEQEPRKKRKSSVALEE